MGLMARRALRRAFREMNKKKSEKEHSFAEEWRKSSWLDKIGGTLLFLVFVYFLFRYFLGLDLLEFFDLSPSA